MGFGVGWLVPSERFSIMYSRKEKKKKIFIDDVDYHVLEVVETIVYSNK